MFTAVESWQSWGGGTPDAQREFFRRRWEGEPGLHGLTDARGIAVIELQVTALDAQRGNEPPASRDWLSGREYIIRLQNGETQETRLVLKRGASAKTRGYTVTVVDVTKPRYVDAGDR